MDGTHSAPPIQKPGLRSDAHHAWLTAGSSDYVANATAYQLARADVPESVCRAVFELHDSAQHHFITMLLWQRGNAGFMSVDEAFTAARSHHAAVTT